MMVLCTLFGCLLGIGIGSYFAYSDVRDRVKAGQHPYVDIQDTVQWIEVPYGKEED